MWYQDVQDRRQMTLGGDNSSHSDFTADSSVYAFHASISIVYA